MILKIPATMATQHPDNVHPPYWERDGDGFISSYEEVTECYSSFDDLGCEEFMWDWEGKYVDEAVIDKLFYYHFNYFKKKQLGQDKFLTFRIPNIQQDKSHSLARALMGILTAKSFAGDLGLHTPPIFEVILPMTGKAEHIIYIQDIFTKLAKFKCKLFNQACNFSYLKVMPLLENVDDLLNAHILLNRYVTLHQKKYQKRPAYLRLHIARSDPALHAGLVAAVVSGKAALSEYYRFSKDSGVAVYPAIGVGVLPFRGGLSPMRVADFLIEYPGIRTVYLQSAFRYDYPLMLVKKAIATLNKTLPQTPAVIYSQRELNEMRTVCEIFQRPYRQTIIKLADTINSIAPQVPARRERKLHMGMLGYARCIGNKQLPRAIPFTAVLYSLGLPPELIGTGRGLAASADSGIKIDKYYINFQKDLLWAGRFLNKNNLASLARSNRVWRAVQDDVMLIEKYLGCELGPHSKNDWAHYNITSSAFLRWRTGKSMATEIMESGKWRGSLG